MSLSTIFRNGPLRFGVWVVFIILAAALARLADLSTGWIIAVIVIAWALVAAMERSAHRAATLAHDREEMAATAAPAAVAPPRRAAAPPPARPAPVAAPAAPEAPQAAPPPPPAVTAPPAPAPAPEAWPEAAAEIVPASAPVSAAAPAAPVPPEPLAQPAPAPAPPAPPQAAPVEDVPVAPPAPAPIEAAEQQEQQEQQPEEQQSEEQPEELPAVVERPLFTRPVVSAVPGLWNLWELEAIAREASGTDPGRDEERSLILMYLREFASSEGLLGREFDDLVHESFGDLLPPR